MIRDYLIPAPVDVRTLDLLGAAVAGGFLLAPLSDAQRGLERLSDGEMPSGALRFVLGAVRAVAGADIAPSVTAVAAHIRSTGALPESNLPHIGALLADLISPDVCPAGPGELVRIPDGSGPPRTRCCRCSRKGPTPRCGTPCPSSPATSGGPPSGSTHRR